MKREMVRARGLTGEEEGSKGIMTRGGGDRGRGDRSDTSDHRDSLAVNRKHCNLGHLDSIATR